MHIVALVLLVTVIAVALWWSLRGRQTPMARPVATTMRFAYLSAGKLFVHESEGTTKELQSPFALDAARRAEQIRERRSWREGTAFNIGAGGRYRSHDPDQLPHRMTAVASGVAGEVYYAMSDEAVGGIFRCDASGGQEYRLLFQQKLKVASLVVSPGGEQIAATVEHNDGTASVALMDSDGNGLKKVTGGDSYDSAPCWVPNYPQRLLFQSSGVARSQAGHFVAMGPSSVQLLNLENGTVSAVLEDPGHDFLGPRVHANGDLLFVRRPYRVTDYKPQNALLDVVLFPFRLARAFFHFLNFFSLTYSRKPLTTASGTPIRADLQQILLQGRMIDAEKALRTHRGRDGAPSLVPDDWELVRRSTSGDEQVLARGVASFDVTDSGEVLYSNGFSLFVLGVGDTARLVRAEEVVGFVTILRPVAGDTVA